MEGDNNREGDAPMFLNTKDLVNFSLGIEETQGGEEAVEDGTDVDEMETSYNYDDDEDVVMTEMRPVVGGDIPRSATEGLSNYYNVSEEDERIRNITNEYIEGRVSLLEFAAAMEHFGKLSSGLNETEAEGDEDGLTPPSPEKKLKPLPSLVLLTPEMAGYNSDPQPGTSRETMSEAESVKLKGEFFRSGDEIVTFSIRKKRKMPPTIKSLMGEAHVRYARGDLTGAETICMEVIKEQPTYKDPFHTLAMVYESQGNKTKALQFFLIYALLDPKRYNDWPRLAELSIEESNLQQAIMCLTKALNSEPNNVKLHLRRCQLFKDIDDTKAALKGFQKVHQMTTDGKTKVDVAKEIAHLYFQMGEVESAYQILNDTFSQYTDEVTFYELNLLAEVCISVKKYVEALVMFIKHKHVRFIPDLHEEDLASRLSVTEALGNSNRECVIPLKLHSDLMQKIAVVLIHLEAFRFSEQIVNRLLDVENIEEFGLQLFEIAEAYIAKRENRLALRLLNPLTKSESYSEAEVWLRYAECLAMMKKYPDAAEAFEKVISLAPNHKTAKLNLSIILQRLGKFDGALQSLDQNDVEDLIDHNLLLERCKIYLSQNRIPEFYQATVQLFSRHCPQIRDIEEAQALISTSNSLQQLEGLRSLRIRKGEPITDISVEFEEKPLEKPKNEWKLYITLLRIFLHMGRYDLFARLAYTVWASKLFQTEAQMKQEVDFHAALASTLNGEQDLTPLHYRFLFASCKLSTVMVNMLGLALRKGTKFKYGRQIIRLLKKHPSDLRLMLLSAHNSFITGTYKYALIEYLQIITEIPTNALCHLMVAITLMHMVSQRTTSNRLRLVLYMIGFLRKYVELRGRCQESYYNLARAYHFIGFYSQALRYYKKVLTSKPVEDDKYYGGIPCKEDGTLLFKYGNQLDLKQEAAYNIAHIYKSLGMYSHARMYIFKYITI